MRDLIFCSFAVISAAACSDDSASSAETTPADGPAIARLSAAMCSLYERCNLPYTRIYGTGVECRETYEAALRAASTGPDSEIDRLIALYDPCLERLDTEPCPSPDGDGAATSLSAVVSACAFEENAPCASDVNCGPGYVCSPERGTCVAREPGTCETVLDCDGDEYCDFDTGRCAIEAPLGAACNRQLECETGYCADGVCRESAAEGEACAVSSECELFLNCLDGRCTAPGGVGDRCGGGVYSCRGLAACNGGVCVAVSPEAQAGAPCSPFVENCRADLRCDFETNLCSP